MGDEQKGDEIQNILSDLDSILSDVSAPTPEAAPEPPKAAPKLPPAAAASPPKPEPKPEPKPAPAPPPKPAAPAPVINLAPAAAPPPAAPPPPAPAPTPSLSIELGAKPAAAAPPPKKESPPAAPPKPALTTRPPLELSVETPGGPSNPAPPAPKPAPAPPPPAPASAAMPNLGADDVPDKTPKEQIRRVAFLFTADHVDKKDVLAKFMSSSAQTISKKPLFLRRVMFEQVGPSADGKGILGRVEAVKAVAVLGILEGLPDAKVRELTEVFVGAGILFRVVAPEEIQKRSMAVDLIVDMMLLSPEC